MPDKMWVSDIDRTLIFSTSFLKDYPSDVEKVEVETVREDFHAYMDKKAYDALSEYAQNNIFVPVTSRTVQQYNRIDFGFRPKYAITSVGGVILENDKPIEEWIKFILSNIDYKEADSLLDYLKSKGFEPKMLDGCFLFFKAEPDLDMSFVKKEYPNWYVITQNKKYYVIPNHISKSAAIKWLKDYLGIKKIAASGDSDLDMDMLDMADFSVVPDTAYIKDCAKEKGYEIANGGISSTTEMIERIKNL